MSTALDLSNCACGALVFLSQYESESDSAVQKTHAMR